MAATCLLLVATNQKQKQCSINNKIHWYESVSMQYEWEWWHFINFDFFISLSFSLRVFAFNVLIFFNDISFLNVRNLYTHFSVQSIHIKYVQTAHKHYIEFKEDTSQCRRKKIDRVRKWIDAYIHTNMYNFFSFVYERNNNRHLLKRGKNGTYPRASTSIYISALLVYLYIRIFIN